MDSRSSNRWSWCSTEFATGSKRAGRRWALTRRNVHGLFRQDGTALDHEQRLASLSSDDEIWHHAFYVSTPRDVTNLHAELQALTAENPKYSMPYNAPVHNRHDGSFHTKIVMRPPGESRRELEFVTEYQAQPSV